MSGDWWGLAPFVVILASVVALICFIIYSGDIRSPEWLFPHKRRWLRYFFQGIGILLLVLTSPFWIWFIGPLVAIWWVSERIINAVYPERHELPRREEAVRPLVPQTQDSQTIGSPGIVAPEE